MTEKTCDCFLLCSFKNCLKLCTIVTRISLISVLVTVSFSNCCLRIAESLHGAAEQHWSLLCLVLCVPADLAEWLHHVPPVLSRCTRVQWATVMTWVPQWFEKTSSYMFLTSASKRSCWDSPVLMTAFLMMYGTDVTDDNGWTKWLLHYRTVKLRILQIRPASMDLYQCFLHWELVIYVPSQK